MFDATKYKIGQSAAFEVPDAEGNVIYLDEAETTPWTITIASPGAKKAVRALFERKQTQQADVFKTMRGKKSGRAEDSDIKDRAEFLMKIVESTNAQDLVFEGHTGMDALRAIFLDPAMSHVAVGLENFHADQGNFTADAPTISSSTSAT